MPLLDTQGNDSADAYGGGVASVINYIENVFSTYLFNTSTSNQNIVNGIDLATYGGLTWIKSRSNVFDHVLQTSAGSVNNNLSSNSTVAAFSGYYRIADLSNGFTFGTDYYTGTVQTAVSWTFRKQPKFFDVVTYTGNGTSQTINHNLGATPGFIICKSTTSARNWLVYHKSIGNTNFLQLDTTIASTAGSTAWNNTSPTSTQFTVGSSLAGNENGQTFVAYLFADNAGGFGLTGTDNVITCGSFTTDGSGNATVNLGYEPQWVMLKTSSTSQNWFVLDTMRGWSLGPNEVCLSPNLTSAESVFNSSSNSFFPTATGFQSNSGLSSSTTFIYIAIRRGPMKVPTDATKLFAPNLATSGAGNVTFTPNFVVDFNISKERYTGDSGPYAITRLLNQSLTTSDTSVAASNGNISFASNTSVQSIINNSSASEIGWSFQRAPSFFDIVCYTGTATGGQTYTHNLGVAPELMIIKSRSAARAWQVYSANLTTAYYLTLNSTNAKLADGGGGDWYGTVPTSTVFSVGTNFVVNNVGETYVAYLFATCAGVSKVGSYTGNGTSQAIACGFTGGARFVLIKRTDASGGWYVYDTARGMTTSTDPYSFMNSTAAEVATLGSVTTTTGGFTVDASILSAINTSSATYIFLAIA